MAYVVSESCVFSGDCFEVCPVGAISLCDSGAAQIDPIACIDCGECASVCPVDAISYDQTTSAILEKARYWHGTPYLWGGDSEYGIDGPNFVHLVYQASGLNFDFTSVSSFQKSPRFYETLFPSNGDIVIADQQVFIYEYDEKNREEKVHGVRTDLGVDYISLSSINGPKSYFRYRNTAKV